MKITIEIPEKIVNLASATLIAQMDNAELETAVSDAVKSLNEEMVITDLSELAEKAYPMKLALAMMAIGNKVGEYQRKEDEETIAAVREKGMVGLADRLRQMQDERERIMKKQRKNG